jgi:hypothetical protein
VKIGKVRKVRKEGKIKIYFLPHLPQLPQLMHDHTPSPLKLTYRGMYCLVGKN